MACTFVKVDTKTEIAIDKIINHICDQLKLEVIKVKEQKRKREYTDARLIIVERIRHIYGKTVPYIFIGKIFGRNNHLFALQSEMECKKLVKVNNKFREKYNKVLESF